MTHSAPGNTTLLCPCLVHDTTRGYREIRSDKDEFASFLLTILCTVCITTVYILCVSPLISHVFLLLIPTHPLETKATGAHWNIQAACSHIFWYATDSKGLLFCLYGYACCGATWKSPPLHFIHLFVSAPPHPPMGPRRDLAEMEGSQQSVPFQGERDIEAILQWFPKWYLKCLSFSCFGEQYSLR